MPPTQLSKRKPGMQAIRVIQKVSRCWLAAGCLLLGGIPSAVAATPPQMMGGADASLATQLYTESGLAAEKEFLLAAELPAKFFANPLTLLFIGMPPSQVELVKQMYIGTFDVEEYYQAVQQRFADDLQPAHATEVLNFFSGRVGRRIVEMKAAANQEFLKALQSGKGLQVTQQEKQGREDLPSGKRMAQIARLAKAQGLVQHDMAVIRSILKSVAPFNEYFQSEPVDVMIQKLEGNLPEYMKTMRVVTLFRLYEGLSNLELNDAVSFYETEAGRWFTRTHNAAFMDGQETMNRKARGRIAQALSVLEEGLQDKPIFKKLFPPGLRHLFTRKRDPFAALIEPESKKKKKKQEEEDAVVVERFGEELAALKSIPFEGYQQLKQADPVLYDKLEFYGQLFRERTELEALTQEEYQEEINRYLDMIEQAGSVLSGELLTPLQAPYESLKLVGMVSIRDGHLALIQTSDSKGYTIRPGMFIGPVFGVVEAIQEDRIEILERSRTYDGSIETNTTYISFIDQDKT